MTQLEVRAGGLLGQGNFGAVVPGAYAGGGGAPVPVAVKVQRCSSDEEARELVANLVRSRAISPRGPRARTRDGYARRGLQRPTTPRRTPRGRLFFDCVPVVPQPSLPTHVTPSC